MSPGFQLLERLEELCASQTRDFLAGFLAGEFAPAAPSIRSRLIKYSPLRLVLRLSDESPQPGVLKLYRISGIAERLRSLWLRSRARKEKRNLELARERGLPCPRVIEARWSGGLLPRSGMLLLEDLGPGKNVPDLLLQGEPEASTRLLLEVGRLIARALAKGLVHRDLHLGNFFVDAKGKLFLLDLHSASFRPQAVKASVPMMERLYLSLPWPEEVQLREALFAPLSLPATPGCLAGWHRRALDRRLARCLRSSGSFYRQGNSVVRRSFLNGHDMGSIEKAIGKAEILKSGRRGSVQRTSLGVFKTRKSGQGKRLWLASHALEQRGLGTPQSLAFLPRGRGQSLVLCSELCDSTAIDRLESGIDEAAAEFGRCYGRLHATGWRCRDPRGDNVHVTRTGKLSFVDLDGVCPLPAWRRLGAQASDLGRLLAWSKHEAVAIRQDKHGSLARTFLRAYLRERRALQAKAKSPRALVHAIKARAAAWQEARQ